MKKITPLIAIFAASSLLAEGTNYTWYTGSTTQDARYPTDETKTVQNYVTGSDVSALSWADSANWSTDGGESSASTTPSVSDNATIIFNNTDLSTAKVLLSDETTTLSSLSVINPNYNTSANITLTVDGSNTATTLDVDNLYLEGAVTVGGTSTSRLDVIADTVNIAIGNADSSVGQGSLLSIGTWGGITSIDFGTLNLTGQTYKTLRFRGVGDFADGSTSTIDTLNYETTGASIFLENNSKIAVGTFNVNAGDTSMTLSSGTSLSINELVIAASRSIAITSAGTLEVGTITADATSTIGLVSSSVLTLTGTGTYAGVIMGKWNVAAVGDIVIASGADQTFTGYTKFSYSGGSEDGSAYGTTGVDLSYIINAGGKLTINYTYNSSNTNYLVNIENSGTLVAGGSSVEMGDLLLFGGSTLELNIENVVENEAVFEIYGTLELSLDNNNVSIEITGTSDLEQFILFSAENDDLSDIDLTAFIVANGELSYDIESNTIIFTSTIPEPSTYALIFGVLALGFTYYRRRK